MAIFYLLHPRLSSSKVRMEVRLRFKLVSLFFQCVFELFNKLKGPIPPLPAHPTAVQTALAALPLVRNPELRPNRVLRLSCNANVESNLAQFTGQVNNPECSHCSRKNGVFSSCVSVTGQLNGSCANCHYNNEGIRCSLREFFPGCFCSV